MVHFPLFCVLKNQKVPQILGFGVSRNRVYAKTSARSSAAQAKPVKIDQRNAQAR